MRFFILAAMLGLAVNLAQGGGDPPEGKAPDTKPLVDDPKGGGEVRIAPVRAELPPLRADYPVEFHPALVGEEKAVAELPLYGPEAAECVAFEPEGLRITLPPTYPRQRPGTGVVTDFGVRGDFEITVAFEILDEPRPGITGNPTGLSLVVVPNERPAADLWHRTSQNRTTLSRETPRSSNLGQFVAALTRWNNKDIPRDKWGNEVFSKVEELTVRRSLAAIKTGRLRLVRNGSELFFLASDGLDEDFILLHRDEFGTKDLKNVRVLGSTGWSGAALDVRVTDLRIRADAFPKASGPVLQPVAAASSPAESPREGRWIRLLAISVLPIAVGFALAWIYVRRRAGRPGADAAESAGAAGIVLVCTGCAKRLRVKAELAGKKLKCPQCKETVAVPSSQPVKTQEAS